MRSPAISRLRRKFFAPVGQPTEITLEIAVEMTVALRKQELEFSVSDNGERLDVFLNRTLSQHGPTDLSFTRSKLKKLIEQGAVRRNGRPELRPGCDLRPGDIIRVTLEDEKPSTLLADASVQLQVVYEDADLIVIDKPAGLVVHPGAGNRSGTLVQGMIHHLRGLPAAGENHRPGLVHRLDKDTSGLMVVAKTEHAFASLSQQFLPPRQISRRYLALVSSLPKSGFTSGTSGVIDMAIARHKTVRTKMQVVKKGGRESVTHWKVIESFKHGKLLELVLETGRTHQIRVHLRSAGAPIVGDRIYGLAGSIPKHLKSIVDQFGRQALHAYRLSFVHPRTGKRVEFESPLPKDLESLLDHYRS